MALEQMEGFELAGRSVCKYCTGVYEIFLRLLP